MSKLLLIDDDKEVIKINAKYFRQLQYEVEYATNAKSALKKLESFTPDCIIMDVMMPGMDGFKACTKIKEICNAPIIFLTGRDSEDDKIHGLLLGADDYMVKPIDVNEMILRVNALLRRSKIANDKKQVIGDTVLEYDSLSVTRDNETIVLAQKEFYLLYKLLSYPNKVFTRNQLMDEIWGVDSPSDLQTIDVHINRLRRRFENNPDFKIITVRGLGYKVIKNEK